MDSAESDVKALLDIREEASRQRCRVCTFAAFGQGKRSLTDGRSVVTCNRVLPTLEQRMADWMALIMRAGALVASHTRRRATRWQQHFFI